MTSTKITTKIATTKSAALEGTNGLADSADLANLTMTIDRRLYVLLSRVIHASDSEGSYRYALSSIRLEWNDGILTAVCTDGRRLAYCSDTTFPAGVGAFLDEIQLSAPDVRKFLNRCANHDSDFEIIKRLDGLHISWKGARKTLTAEIAIVEGRFPKWRDVFPTGEAPTVWRGKAGALASELDPDDFIAIECQLDPTTKTVSASRPSIQLSVDVIRGNGSTRIDPDFARDYLEALPSDAIVDIQIWEPDSAIWLISQDVNRSTGALIMPLVRSR